MTTCNMCKSQLQIFKSYRTYFIDWSVEASVKSSEATMSFVMIWLKYSFTELFNCLTSFSRLFCYCFQIVEFIDWILTGIYSPPKWINKSLSIWSVAPKCTKQIQLLWTLNTEADSRPGINNQHLRKQAVQLLPLPFRVCVRFKWYNVSFKHIDPDWCISKLILWLSGTFKDWLSLALDPGLDRVI